MIVRSSLDLIKKTQPCRASWVVLQFLVSAWKWQLDIWYSPSLYRQSVFICLALNVYLTWISWTFYSFMACSYICSCLSSAVLCRSLLAACSALVPVVFSLCSITHHCMINIYTRLRIKYSHLKNCVFFNLFWIVYIFFGQDILQG